MRSRGPWLGVAALSSIACGTAPPDVVPPTIDMPVVAASASAPPVSTAPASSALGRTLFTSGASHTCVLDRGVAHCWGFNGYGQLGVGSRADQHTPVRLPFDDIETLDVGGVSTCVVRRGGELLCAGEHEMFGVDEHTTERAFFARAPGFERVKRVAVSVSAVCAEELDGAVRCAGKETDVVPPVAGTRAPAIEGLFRPEALRLEPYYACVIVGGDVRCWGDAWMGLMPGKTPPVGFAATRNPAIVSEVRGAVQIAMGDHHACARMRDGTVSCWGGNTRSKLGRVTTQVSDFVPAPVSGLTDAVDIAASAHHTCAVVRSGDVRCWGDDGTGDVEDGRLVAMPGGARAGAVRAGLMHTCALLVSGDVACWGSNALSQCGGPDGEPARVARIVPLPAR